MESTEGLVRALELARAVSDEDLEQRVVARMVSVVGAELDSGDERPGISYTLLRELVDLPAKRRPPQLGELLDQTEAVYGRDPHHFESVIDLQAVVVDPQELPALRLRQAERWRQAARDAEGILRAAFLERALDVARMHGLRDLARELRVEIDQMSEEDLGLKTVSSEVQVPTEKVEQFIEWFVSFDSWEKSLIAFGAHGPPGGEPDEAERDSSADARRVRSPFSLLAPWSTPTRGRRYSTPPTTQHTASPRSRSSGFSRVGSGAPSRRSEEVAVQVGHRRVPDGRGQPVLPDPDDGGHHRDRDHAGDQPAEQGRGVGRSRPAGRERRRTRAPAEDGAGVLHRHLDRGDPVAAGQRRRRRTHRADRHRHLDRAELGDGHRRVPGDGDPVVAADRPDPILMPLFVWLQLRVGRRRQRLARHTQESLSEMTAITEEALSVSGILLAKVFNRSESGDRALPGRPTSGRPGCRCGRR
jgi:hypothetical protein